MIIGFLEEFNMNYTFETILKKHEEKDEEVRDIELSNDFKTRLEDNIIAFTFYNSLSYSSKRKYFQWISSAKKSETREKRIKEALIKLEEHIQL